MRRYLLKTHNDSDATLYCDLAIVNIDDELLELIKKRKALFDQLKAEDINLLKLGFWNTDVLWYDNLDFDELDEALRYEFDTVDIVQIPQSFEPSEPPARTEVDQMIIHGGHVTWACVPKHGSLYATTTPLTWQELGIGSEQETQEAQGANPNHS